VQNSSTVFRDKFHPRQITEISIIVQYIVWVLDSDLYWMFMIYIRKMCKSFELLYYNVEVVWPWQGSAIISTK
jgi:hypothetical protein